MQTDVYVCDRQTDRQHLAVLFSRVRNGPDTRLDKIKLQLLSPVTFFFNSENRAVYEIVWKIWSSLTGHKNNMIRHMRIACRVPKGTNTHSEYAILIAFPQQQWLREHAAISRYTRALPILFLNLLVPELLFF